MITPILVDFIINIAAFLFGLYVLAFKMRAFNKDIYTPKIETLTINIFMLGWSIFGFKAFAIISRFPPWLVDDVIWTGSWSYTLSRAIIITGFVIMCYVFSKRAEDHRKEIARDS